MSYAKGTRSMGICQRSGRKMRYVDMVMDGYYPWLRVDPRWREERHPQERLPSGKDPTALYRPAPDNEVDARELPLMAAPSPNADKLSSGVRHMDIVISMGSYTVEVV